MSKILAAIPWAMIAPHETRALTNHGQSLQILARRGGLSASEALCILDDKPWNGLTFVLPRDRAERDQFEAEKADELMRRVMQWQP